MKSKRYHRKPITLRSVSHRLMKAGGIEPTEGPYDTAVHRFMSKDNIQRHVEDMKYKRKDLADKEIEELNDFKNKKAELEAEKNKKFQSEEAKRKENLQERLQENISQMNIDKATTENLGNLIKNSSSFIGIGIVFISTILEKGIYAGFTVLSDLVKVGGYGLDRVGSISHVVVNTFMQTVAYNLFKYLFSFIFAILFFVIIILLIIYGASLFTTKSNNNRSTSRSGQQKCSSLLSDTININIRDFSKLFSNNNVTDSLSNIEVRNYVPNIPKYDFIPDTTFSWSNPWGYITTKTGVNNRKFVSTYKSFASGIKAARRLVNDLSGNSTEFLIDREEFETGRCDNELLIDAKFIKNKQLLSDKNINISDTHDAVINIVKPNNITWSLPEDQYINKDLKLLPPSILDTKFQGDKLSIKEKKTIIIPWEQKNDEYRLSCKNSYFMNASDPNDKTNLAKILIDDIGTNTCTIDNSSRANTFRNTKERYYGTDDLNAFLN